MRSCRLLVGWCHWKRVRPILLKQSLNVEWFRHFSPPPYSCTCRPGQCKGRAWDGFCRVARLFRTIHSIVVDDSFVQLLRSLRTRGVFFDPPGGLGAPPAIDGGSAHQSPQVGPQRRLRAPDSIDDAIDFVVSHPASAAPPDRSNGRRHCS